MSIEIKVPALPESVTEATVAEWHKAEGDSVTRDENLADLETDKVVLEVPATDSGTLVKIMVQPGDSVTAGDVLAVLEAGDAAAKKSDDKPAASQPSKAADEAEPAGDVQQSPAVRRLLDEHDLKAEGIPASGKGGRLTKADVEKYLKDNASSKPAAEAKAAPKAADAAVGDRDAGAVGSAPAQDERIEQRVPMTRIRARIAERLVEAQQSAAMLTTFNEVDLHAVDKLRKQYRDVFEKNHKVRLGYMSFFVRAAVEALKRYPIVNASVDGNDIIYHGYYDIGIAVSSPRGLVVPILRDADKLSFAEVESSIGEFGARAKDNKLTMDDLLGGTFSITNGGVFGSMMSTPILNPPQSAILGMHGINKKPVVVNDEIVIRPMMYLALTYDHRIIDGREAVLFLRTIKEVLEDPARMLLEI
ncbi:MAG: 2-oxoglutarate dehydrogenase complex dihydrolipoyllysine-residue succinyltransferase [Oceanococcus sp.]|nr:MAG: 2-oxoglutarate dehydrogenase complex dihydrolipoyllysine-residue succinyltransferase [Oceanococcus sp.]